MPNHRRAVACVALVSVLLLVVMPCTTTTGAVATAATDDNTATTTSYFDYFLGDLFQNPRSMNHNKEPKAPPRFRPWRIIDVPDDSVLSFDCVGDVPTLHFVPRTDDCNVNNTDSTPPPTDNTCGIAAGAQAGTPTPTPMQYKFSRRNDTSGYSALFWQEEAEGTDPQLMPVPKLQLKAILKAVAAMMDSSWRQESGNDDEAVPESVAFSPDMVVFYFKHSRQLVAMGREDVEFSQPWECQRLHGEIAFKPLNLGTVL